MKKLIEFLKRLEKANIYYRLNKIRDSIMVEIAVPGERWEVEFFEDDSMQIERFKSNGEIYEQEELEILFRDFNN